MVTVKRLADENHFEKPWYDDKWVGQATLFGPLGWDEYISPFKNTHSSGKLSEDDVRLLAGPGDQLSSNILDKTAHWHMTALYIDIKHRRLGLAKELCMAAFEHIKHVSRLEGYRSAILRIIIKPRNTIVLDMYKSMGFEIIEGVFSTLAEATYCAGDHGTLPTDYEERKDYSTRGGLFMLKHVDLNGA